MSKCQKQWGESDSLSVCWHFGALVHYQARIHNTTYVQCLLFPHAGFLHCSVPPTALQALTEIQDMRNMAN